MRTRLSILAAALVVAGLAAPAVSQASYLPRRLTSGDMTILQAEAAKLGPHGPKVGSWHNGKSGNSGIVTFLDASTRQGQPCRAFRYTFRTGVPQDGTPYRLTWCRSQAGSWSIAP